MEENTQRNNTVAITKAIAIILMVMVHAGINDTFASFICMFHMPVFFFVSGYCLKDKYLNNVKLFIKRRLSLYWYFISFVSVFVLFHNIFIHWGFYTTENLSNSLVVPYYSIKDFVKHIIFVIGGMNNREPLIGGFWFLRSLFVGSIISLLSLKLIKDKITVTFVIFGVSFLCTLVPNARIAFWISHFLIASFFYISGYLCKPFIITLKYKEFVSILLFVMVFIISKINPCSTMFFGTNNISILALCGVSGSFATFWVSSFIDDKCNKGIKKALIYIGNHTLSILAFHFLSFKIVSICLICIFKMPWSELSRYYIFSCGENIWIIYSIVGVVVPLAGRYLMDKISFSYGK